MISRVFTAGATAARAAFSTYRAERKRAVLDGELTAAEKAECRQAAAKAAIKAILAEVGVDLDQLLRHAESEDL